VEFRSDGTADIGGEASLSSQEPLTVAVVEGRWEVFDGQRSVHSWDSANASAMYAKLFLKGDGATATVVQVLRAPSVPEAGLTSLSASLVLPDRPSRLAAVTGSAAAVLVAALMAVIGARGLGVQLSRGRPGGAKQPLLSECP